jgi:hypothetical protein
MAKDRKPAPDDLYDVSRNLVLQLKRQHELSWNGRRVEDAQHDLYLAGLQVWQDTEDEGLAGGVGRRGRGGVEGLPWGRPLVGIGLPK